MRFILLFIVLFSLPSGMVAAYHLGRYLNYLARVREDRRLRERDDYFNNLFQ